MHSNTIPSFRQIHTSWYLLSGSLLTALFSFFVFSVDTVLTLNSHEEVRIEFPGETSNWKITGNEENFKFCGRSICFESATRSESFLVREISVPQEMIERGDQFVLQLWVSPWNERTPLKWKGEPSFITARTRDKTGKLRGHLQPIIYLYDQEPSKLYRGVSWVQPESHSLLVAIGVRSETAMKLDAIKIHIVNLHSFYQILRFLAFLGWVALLALLGWFMAKPIPHGAKLAGSVLFSGALISGITQYGPWAFDKVVATFISESLVAFIDSYVRDGMINPVFHFTFHFLITLYLFHFSKALQLNAVRILALNTALAIGIESTQMGIPSRSADIQDIFVGMLGSFSCIVGSKCVRSI